MKKLLILNLFIVMFCCAFAGRVTTNDAEKVAKSHYFQASNNKEDWNNIKLILANEPFDSDFKFYVFNIENNKGYVIVAPNDAVKPILAYSFEGSFNADNMSPAQKEYYDVYNHYIEIANKNNIEDANNFRKWQELLNFKPKGNNSSKEVIESPILLEGINWNQDWPYNSACPENAGGSGGHVYVGCVATAMCQIMKYWNWPPSGEGQKTHPNSSNGGYGNHFVPFYNQTYDWMAIPDVAAGENTELGKINYHAGVALNMHWGIDPGSSSNDSYIPNVLKTYFKYDQSATYKNKSSYSDSNWENLIISEIDAKRPIVYSGHGSGAGHAWNCDGYQIFSYGKYFHMNWGWGGAGNNYCSIDTLLSSFSSGGAEDNFIYGNSICTNLIPSTNKGWQQGCAGTVTTRGNVNGSFDDGSAGFNYQNNQNCTYIIQPSCGQVISLKFSKFDLASGDKVEVYKGDVTSPILLVTYDMNNLPYSNEIISNLGTMFLKFITDGSSTADGWKANYKVKTCDTDTIIYTAIIDTIEDGSNSCYYTSNLDCNWRIEPEGEVTGIDFKIENFSVTSNIMDRMLIYKDLPFSAVNLLYEFKNNNQPLNNTYHHNGNKLYIKFKTAPSTTGAEGWKITYNATVIGINDYNSNTNFQIYPNPAKSNEIKISYDADNNFDTKFVITNMLGEIIGSKTIKINSGNNQIMLSDITFGDLVSGMYYLTITTNTTVQTAKFIITY